MKMSDAFKPIHKTRNRRALALAAVALASSLGLNSARAYPIVWDTARNSTADTDVVATGTLVRAVAASPTDGYGATVNGVVFTPYASTPSDPFTNSSSYSCFNTLTWGTGTGSGLWTDRLAYTTPVGDGSGEWGVFHWNGYISGSYPSGLSADYAQALAGERLGGAATMTLGGLTTGQSYLVQLWACDPRGTGGGMGTTTMILDGNASTAMLTNRGYSGDPGQYVIGRFVADGPTQSCTLTGQVLINAYQLRAIDPLPTPPMVAITSPADGATVFTTFTITATAADYNGSIASVTFYDGATQLGDPVTSPPYSYVWSGAAVGDHVLTAKAADNDANETTSAQVTVMVADNAPTVAITSPADAATVPPDFTISATATDDGTITQVDFHDGATLLGTLYTPPYTWAVTGAEPGAHVLTAVAFDNGSHETTSAQVTVMVADNAPTVAITRPADAATVPPDFTISATATDDGTITQVDFHDGATLLGTLYTPPYTWAVTGAEPGAHVLTAVAFDNGSHETTSAQVTVTVVTPVAIAWGTARKIKNIYECGVPPDYYDSAHVAVSEAEISLEGTLVRAVACGTATGSVTVNTVAFEYTLKTGVDAYNSGNGYDPHHKGWTSGVDTFYSNVASEWGIGQNGPTTYNPYGACPSAAYTTLLGGGMQAGDNTVPLTLTLGNLTPGQSYLVQLWCNDSRFGSHSLQTVDGGPTMDRCVDEWVSGLGQYLIGRFTAAGTSQTISILGGSELINAYQLRAISASVPGYDAWAGPAGYDLTGADAGRGADPDGDGFTNIQEFLFGTSPIAGNGALVKSERLGGTFVLHWLQRASGSGYLFQESATMASGEWNPSVIVPELDDQTGVPADYVRYKATVPLNGTRKFFRVEGAED
ncbi:MAG: Ig-like domain-containing protein [Verrucomicrobia bacterium]|nr:Ig-like domain-containing protein [Verrucomicrobiota bacterium]